MNTIYLIGLMGVGKTSTGRMLSNLTNKSFIDLDSEIEKASGLTVANFFKKGAKVVLDYLNPNYLNLFLNP